MSNPRSPIFDAVRRVARPGLFDDPGHVLALDNLLDAFDVPREGTARHGLSDPAAFFAGVRGVTGPLDQVQVDTIGRLLAAASHWPLGWVAYGLATAWHEARLKPIEEWGKGKGHAYGKPGKHGQSQHGRGLVQLTWDANYERADKALGLGGALLKDFGLALDPEIAAKILVRGMEEGWFRRDAKGAHTLSRHLPGWRGAPEQFHTARDIINGGRDKAQLIAGHAVKFQGALEAGGWA